MIVAYHAGAAETAQRLIGGFFYALTNIDLAVALREIKSPRGGSHFVSSVTATAYLLPQLKC